MNEREDAGTEQGGLVVTGSVAALRDLAEPPRLSSSELAIIGWYSTLVRRLSGPRRGDERGPAKEPPWMKRGPQIDEVQIREEENVPAILVKGSGLGATTAVWIDGNQTSWQTIRDDALLIPIFAPTGEEALILIRTPEGDVSARLVTTTT